MLTIHLLFVTIGIRVHERTMQEEKHYLQVKRQMESKTERISEHQPWLF
ncbi:hypothetical protein JI666_06500 [Bacillus sp. NTK071]|nr:hypothetical protein [Bacillus sp. NTK071]MBN8208388.1 hypothetical protein [Bacillus sp. NTK071]